MPQWGIRREGADTTREIGNRTQAHIAAKLDSDLNEEVVIVRTPDDQEDGRYFNGWPVDPS